MYADKATPAFAERARQAAEKAVALAPNRSDGYLALGAYLELVSRDFTLALEQYTKGQRLAPGDADLLRGMGIAEQFLGRWDAALEHFRQAERLAPLSVANLRTGDTLLRLRRYPEAREAFDRGLAVAPTSLALIEIKAMTSLAQGDLGAARAALGAVPKQVEPTALVAYVATYWDLAWVLDASQRELLLRLTPSAFDDDEGVWALSLVQAYDLNADAANVHLFAEKARKAFEDQVRAAPEDPQLHAELGLALAYVRRKEEAIQQGERAVAMEPISRDALNGPYFQHQLVRIYILVGEPERALDQLEPLLKIPCFLSPGWLRIDPNFDPLRKSPRFRQLVAPGSKAA